MLISSPRRLRRALLAGALVFSSAAAVTTIAGPVSAAAAEGDAAMTIAKTTYVRGERVTATVTIATKAKTVRATGTVDFVVDGGAPIPVKVNGAGKAIFSTTTLALGGHTISAFYNGDARYQADDAGRSSVAIIKGSTTTTADSLRDPVRSGTSAWLTARAARVGAAKGSLEGTITFVADAGAGTPTTATVRASSSGHANWAPTLADGTYQVTATYNGNADFRPSAASAPITVVVAPAPSIHTDRAAFEAASNGLVTEDFEDADFSSNPSCSKTVDASTNDQCFRPGQIVDGLTITNHHVGSGGDTIGGGPDVGIGNGTNYLFDNYWDGPFELVFAGGRTAVALDLVRYWGGSGSNCTVTVYGSGDVVVNTTTVTCPDGDADVFVGFTSQTPIERLTITGSAQPYPQGIDNISFGSAGSAR